MNQKEEKTKLTAFWKINIPEILQPAKAFALENPNAPRLYRGWLKSMDIQDLFSADGIKLFDLELHFGALSCALWAMTV